MSQLTQNRAAGTSMIQYARGTVTGLLLLASVFAGPGVFEAQAARSARPDIKLVPTVTSVAYDTSGQLIASGVATATVKGGKTYTAPFTAPLTIQQSTCDVLDLQLGPINLNLLGLVLETSPICLSITADPAGGLLGGLLCGVANLLNAGLPLSPQILTDLVTLLNGVLPELSNAAIVPTGAAAAAAVAAPRTCTVLDLALGPVDLTLLGLNVHLDDCQNGPVTVTLTALTGQGNLLGNLLCQLVGGGTLDIGTTLQEILNQLLALLNL